ncbi:MAG: DUF2061 domain-containing protein [Chloroflexi bacterium]|nr:DUF2061 domain-containing protein [Chloroflexota bacterium]
MALSIGLADTLIKLASYYFHERAWEKIRFGRPKPPEYNLSRVGGARQGPDEIEPRTAVA